ncbi:GntR family transcriptional regulator [Vibrio anguillarum]|uniref:GntR family transcriptional regulator n=3 Tax=Vibrio TaxID=662 RepID=A0AAW4BBX2_VIBAN|nr:GntR family transcriptional regulator [Vibrio anguillarum]ASU24426.1 GntR family transcriptional regulator [Vibrio qinghaiensis]NNN48176.1 GntR family transcriptional regulator [Vibrio sp. 2-2(8)]NNN68407.1 GntR family transcriptional regulator [Vibrio sp. 3-2(1)]NNN95894.1 GntR family transcriptional regulator [Vibrio sp. B4-6]OXX54409.1 GntR family transcriptional regulator [Vibrio sp. V12_P9A6T4]
MCVFLCFFIHHLQFNIFALVLYMCITLYRYEIVTDWQDNQPIFRQLADKITEQILQGIWLEDSALPSVRTVSADMKINHLTVMKGYQLLVDEGIVEKRRGQGMYVAKGALAQLQAKQKQHFLEQQIPEIAQTLKLLAMPLEDFINQLQQHIEGDQ